MLDLLIEFICFRRGHKFSEFRETELKGMSKRVSVPLSGKILGINQIISSHWSGIIVQWYYTSIDR